ncbi:MAG TPA: hypothetical protein QF423_02230 [Candidatus Scalindua sp.]|nr:hypothetical protein [Candidatus Scalindua sp.]
MSKTIKMEKPDFAIPVLGKPTLQLSSMTHKKEKMVYLPIWKEDLSNKTMQ